MMQKVLIVLCCIMLVSCETDQKYDCGVECYRPPVTRQSLTDRVNAFARERQQQEAELRRRVLSQQRTC